MANPWEFLEAWSNENVQATVYNDTATAKLLAAQCLQAAKEARIAGAGVIKAAGGNLESFMLDALDRAANGEVDRLVAKDKS